MEEKLAKAKSLKYDLDCIAHRHAADFSWRMIWGTLVSLAPLAPAYFFPVKYQDIVFFSCIPISLALFICFLRRACRFSVKCPACGELLNLNGPKWHLISVSVECQKCGVKSDEEYPFNDNP